MLRASWTRCSCSSGTSIPTSAAMGDEGDHRGGSMLTSSEPPSLTSRAPGMLSNQNVSPVRPNLWEHYNSNKTHLGSCLPSSWHQLSSPFPGRLVRELGVPESQASKPWQPGASVSTSYIPWGMQPEVSLCSSHIPVGIPSDWRAIFSSTVKHLLQGRTLLISFFFFLIECYRMSPS